MLHWRKKTLAYSIQATRNPLPLVYKKRNVIILPPLGWSFIKALIWVLKTWSQSNRRDQVITFSEMLCRVCCPQTELSFWLQIRYFLVCLWHELWGWQGGSWGTAGVHPTTSLPTPSTVNLPGLFSVQNICLIFFSDILGFLAPLLWRQA